LVFLDLSAVGAGSVVVVRHLRWACILLYFFFGVLALYVPLYVALIFSAHALYAVAFFFTVGRGLFISCSSLPFCTSCAWLFNICRFKKKKHDGELDLKKDMEECVCCDCSPI